MARFVHALALGLVGAGIVHLSILFLLPAHSVRDVWTRLSQVGEPYATLRLDAAGQDGLPAPADPFIQAAACRFDLAEGMLHLAAEGTVPFWSISIYDDNGLNVFSITDGAAADGRLDAVVLAPAQARRLHSRYAAQTDRSVLLQANVGRGIALVRVFVPDETWQGVATAFLESLRCAPLPLE